MAPLFLAIMHADVAEPELPACGAVGVAAGLGERVHRRPFVGTVWRPCSGRCLMDPRFATGCSLFTVPWGAITRHFTTSNFPEMPGVDQLIELPFHTTRHGPAPHEHPQLHVDGERLVRQVR